MKRLLILIALLLWSTVCSAQELAWMNPVIAESVSTTTLSCGATNQLESYTTNGTTNFASTGTTLWRSSLLTYGGTSGTLCKMQVEAKCSSTGCDQIVTGYLYSNNPTGDGGTSDGVGTLIGTCTGTYNTVDLDTTAIFIDLTSCSGTITNGTKYWMVVSADNATGDYVVLSKDSTCSTGEKYGSSSDGVTWTYSTDDCIVFKAYILE